MSVMTRDDIIRLAREADSGFEGGPDADGTLVDSLVGLDAIERFAALVAAEKDREILALKEERRKDMAEIYSLRESEESLREKLREQLPNTFREGFYRGFQAAFEDAAKESALQGETAIWSARNDPRE